MYKCYYRFYCCAGGCYEHFFNPFSSHMRISPPQTSNKGSWFFSSPAVRPSLLLLLVMCSHSICYHAATYQAVAGVYPGLVEAKTAGREGEASPSSLAGIVADVVYPRAVEAFLSAAGPSPCWPNEHDCDDDTKTAGFVDNADSSASSTTGVKSVNDISQAAAVARNKIGEDGIGGGDGGCGVDSSRCRCYRSSAGVAAMLEPARRGVSCKRQRTKQHDPWDAFEALRPEQQPPQPPLSKNPGGNGGSRSAFAAAVVAEDSEASGIGAVLLLCEALSCEETRLSKTVRARLGECCSWILDHLSYLFPSWVEAAAAPEGVGTDKKEARSWYERARLVSPLCQKAAAALGCYVSRRAVAGEFEDVQVMATDGNDCFCRLAERLEIMPM